MAGDALPGAVFPDFGGACVASLVPALFGRHSEAPPWLPPALAAAEQIVLLIVDGLGALQLDERHALVPALRSMQRSTLTTVAPSTTATALTSISTGLIPAEHGVLGYRMDERGEVFNVLRWQVGGRDVREKVDPATYQPHLAFFGRPAPVVSRANFAGSGFTEAHLRGAPLIGWSVPSSIAVEVRRLLGTGEPFVYAYYDGLDRIAHERGLGAHYDAELVAVDHLVDELCAALPPGAALGVCADHGEMELTSAPIALAPLLSRWRLRLSGEGRFRWIHARPRDVEAIAVALAGELGELAWVLERDRLIGSGLFGGPLRPEHAARLGQLAVVARGAVSFSDPDDPGEARLVGRHGSLSRGEMYVPLLGWRR